MPQNTLRRKITWIILSGMAVTIVPLILLGYMRGYRLLRDSVGQENVRIAELMAQAMNRIIRDEVEDFIVLASREEWGQEIKRHYQQYEGMPDSLIRDSVARQEARWEVLATNGPDIIQYQESPLGRRLKNITQTDADVNEIFVADIYGGIIAASNRTSDFYQADEDWWQEAYDDGRGQIYMGGIECDDSTLRLAVPIAVPIRDQQGNVIAISKMVIDALRLLAPLEDFHVGASGHAILINQAGDILFHRDVKPLQEKYCAPACLAKILKMNREWSVFEESFCYQKRPVLLAVADVNNPFLKNAGLMWKILVARDFDDAFFPLILLRKQIILLVSLAFVLWLVIGNVAGAMIAVPLEKITAVVRDFGKGRLDQRIKIKSRDEIRDLAEAINQMAGDLQSSTTSFENLNREIEERRNTERALAVLNERLVANETALKNILYDLKEANDHLKEAQNQLIQSEKMAAIGQLSAGVAHEIKNPLAIILLSAEGLQSKIGHLSEKEARYVKMIKESAQRADKIVLELLQFSRQSTGFKNVLLTPVLEKTVSLFKNTIKNKAIAITEEYAHHKIMVEADAIMLQQVFFNVLNNAADAIKGEGAITIKSHVVSQDNETSQVTVLEISDTGCGIAPKNISRVFDPFFTTKEPGKGTGLGLSLAYMILEKHNGTIEVHSQEGKGATFRITLPLAEIDV